MALNVVATAARSARVPEPAKSPHRSRRRPASSPCSAESFPSLSRSPAKRTVLPPRRHFAAAHFGRVSVVMIARANSVNASALDRRAPTSCRHGMQDFLAPQRHADHARRADQHLRVVNFAPPGSGCFRRSHRPRHGSRSGLRRRAPSVPCSSSRFRNSRQCRAPGRAISADVRATPPPARPAPIWREHRRCHSRRVARQNRQVQVRLLQPAVHRRKRKSAGNVR